MKIIINTVGMFDMISIEQALTIIQQNLPERKVEKIAITEAIGRLLSEDIRATTPSPTCTNSAMDGFAVRWEDVATVLKGEKIKLDIVGESQAGIPFSGTMQKNQTVRISTGAMLPDGSDTVVPVEDCSIEDHTVIVNSIKKQSQNVRFQGEEYQATEVAVYQKPMVAVITTGTELVPYDQAAAPHQIRDSNQIMISSAVTSSGGVIRFQGHAGDSLAETIHIIEQAAVISQIIIITGGVSVGPHDHVKQAAQQAGFHELFWRVKQKPGKPLFFARKGEHLLFGLPGNPGSSCMGYSHYIQRVVRFLCGRSFQLPEFKARLTSPISNPQQRARLLQAIAEPVENDLPAIRPFEKQGSNMLISLARSNGYIILQPGQSFSAGETITTYPFPWRNVNGLY